MTDLYKQDGVDVPAGDAFSRFCAEINRSTFEVSPYVRITDLSYGNFRGPKGYGFVNLPKDCLHTGGMDGVGTKVVIDVASGRPATSASNLIAMTAMDITRWGGLPLLFMNTLDVRSLGEVGSETFKMYQEIMTGLQEIALRERYVLFNGETAELGACVSSENPHAKLMFNWCGAMIGVYHPLKMIRGATLRPGQVIVALKDDLRSNGISSVRKALAIKYGSEWWNNPAAMSDIIAAASPSVQYDRMLNTAHGWFDEGFLPKFNMHLIVHLSGGAFESKLGKDILERVGLSASLPELFDPPEIMKKCADWRGMDSLGCHKTWNCGQGAIAVLDSDQGDDFVSFAKDFGIVAKVAGKITERKDYNIEFVSKFDGETYYY